jgi:sugar phosphate permease
LCMGVFGLAIGLGATLGTMGAGAIVDGFDAGPAFVALAGAGGAGVLLVLFAMPETLRPVRRPAVGGYARGAA